MVDGVAYQLDLKLLAQTRSLPEGGRPRRRCAEPTGKVLIISPFGLTLPYALIKSFPTDE
jgi:hypothetical protein